MELNKVHNIDAREGIPKLDDESIDCVVTSPPYWSLRDYGLEPQVWGGESECQHLWGDKSSTLLAGKLRNGLSSSTLTGSHESWGNRSDNSQGAFCTRCGAWRGSLGLEPTFDMYIDHLVGIFDLIKPKLKKTGTMWVNLGTTMQNKNDVMIPERFALEMTNSNYVLKDNLSEEEKQYVLAELVNYGIL